MEAIEVVHVDSEIVGCDGDGGALGHPLVYLHIGGDGAVDCPYCSRRFVLKRTAEAASDA